MTTTTCILIANSSAAKLYTIPKAKLFNGNPNLTLFSEHGHPESRKKAGNLVSDRSGHMVHGTMVESSNPKNNEVEYFARELVDALEKGRVSDSFQEIIIIAPSQFQGLLNKHLSDQTANLITINIDKDYTQDTEKSLINHLQNYL